MHHSRLPNLAKWPHPVNLYPYGDWLLDPSEHPEYVYQLADHCQWIDLKSVPAEEVLDRLYHWQVNGRLHHSIDLEFMNDSVKQSVPSPIHVETTKLNGFDLIKSHTLGYRSQYQDRVALFYLPFDMDQGYSYCLALFDGHGPIDGGDQIAHLLSQTDGGQTLTLAIYEWAVKLKKRWPQMSDSEQENGWHYAALKLQEMIKQKVMSLNLDKMAITQAKSMALSLKNTLKQLTNIKEPFADSISHTIDSLSELESSLDQVYSLEGVGSTAVLAILYPRKELDEIDVWIINIGDSWCGLLGNHEHFALVDEATPSKSYFRDEIEQRGGWIEKDDFGTDRLNGMYSLCRGLGDFYFIDPQSSNSPGSNECCQVLGMSPRPTVTRFTLCEKPTRKGQIAYSEAIALVQHSDGLKERHTLTSDQICSLLAQGIDNFEQVASQCIQRAVEGGSFDNCTLQILDLRALHDEAFRKKWYKDMQPHFSFRASAMFQGFF
jgi:serine/threonine protein phosphatase PrpC